MPIQVLMPALSPTMTEGNLAKWLVNEGDEVRAGDVLAEIETDKATMEVEAVDEGVLGKILVPEGTEGVAINTPIALLLEEGEDASEIGGATAAPGAAPAAKPEETQAPSPKSGNGKARPAEAAPKEGPAPGAAAPATPLARRMAAQAGIDLAGLTGTAPGGKIGKADVRAAVSGEERPAPAPPAGAEAGAEGRIFASPLARSMARQAGLELGQLSGSGPGGRIVKADIEAALARPPAAEAPAPAPAREAPAAPGAVPDRTGAWDEIKHSNVRKIIAARMAEAAREIPHIYLTVECEIDRLLAVRKEINAAADEDYKVSVNDILIKSAALALRKVPGVNAQWTEGAVRRLHAVDVSVAVAYDGGLVTPIVFDADRKGIAQISREMKDLAGRARAGRLRPEEYQGGSFSVSNLGMYGISHFTAVINPPQACILAIGAGQETPVVRGDEITVATIMRCTLSCDHRVVDGALGAEWLRAFKGLVERPATMLA